MSKFNVQIQYPNHANENDVEQYKNLEIEAVKEKFNSISWRKQRVSQLQFNGKNTVFKVTESDTKAYLSLSLNAYSKSDDFEFKVESNIQFSFPQRELFGLMTRQNKEMFTLKQATLEQATQSLSSFLNQDLKVLEIMFLNSKNALVQNAS